MSDFIKQSSTGQDAVTGGFGLDGFGVGAYGTNEEVSLLTEVRTDWGPPATVAADYSDFTLVSRTGQDQLTGYGTFYYGEGDYGVSPQVDFTAFTDWTPGANK